MQETKFNSSGSPQTLEVLEGRCKILIRIKCLSFEKSTCCRPFVKALLGLHLQPGMSFGMLMQLHFVVILVVAYNCNAVVHKVIVWQLDSLLSSEMKQTRARVSYTGQGAELYNTVTLLHLSCPNLFWCYKNFALFFPRGHCNESCNLIAFSARSGIS